MDNFRSYIFRLHIFFVCMQVHFFICTVFRPCINGTRSISYFKTRVKSHVRITNMTLFFVSRSRFKVKTPKNYLRYLFKRKSKYSQNQTTLGPPRSCPFPEPRGSGIGILGATLGPPQSCPHPEGPGSASWRATLGPRAPVRSQRSATLYL